MVNNPQTDLKTTVLDIWNIFKSAVIGMLITGIIFGGTAAVISKKLIAPKYSAMSALYIVSASETVLNISDLQVGSSLTDDYIYLITSRPFITEMKQRLGLGSEYTYGQLKSMVSVRNPSDTHAIEITATTTDSKLAADMANALAEVSVTRLADIMESSHPKIIEYAASHGGKVSPNSTFNAIVSFALGAIAFFAVSYIRRVMDNTVKSVEDVENKLGLNVLGVVNIAADDRTKSRKKVRRRKKTAKRSKKTAEEQSHE